MKIVLASSSKQRKDIFDMIGLKYEVIKSLEEEKSFATNPEIYVKEVSKVKADSVIYMDNKIYEKPKSKK